MDKELLKKYCNETEKTSTEYKLCNFIHDKIESKIKGEKDDNCDLTIIEYDNVFHGKMYIIINKEIYEEFEKATMPLIELLLDKLYNFKETDIYLYRYDKTDKTRKIGIDFEIH